MRNLWITMFLVLAGVGYNYAPQTGGGEPSGDGSKTGASEPLTAAPAPIDDPVGMIEYFLDPLDQSEPHVRRRELGCPFETPSSTAYPGLRFIIATLPDPERTHLSLYFDRWIESILAGAHEAGYRFDVHWLPWSAEPAKTGLRPKDQEKVDQDAESRGRQPGVLVFHRTISDWLIIFLVGETPTAGINQRQFANAACYIASFAPGASVDVMGPQFSGSVDSFNAARNNLPAGVRIGQVLSGGMNGSKPLRDGQIHTMQHNTDFLAKASRAAADVLHLGRKTAVLAEGTTAYGSAIAESSAVGKQLTVYYPHEISRLRNTFPEQSNPSGGADKGGSAPAFGLTLRLHDSRTGSDTLPEFSEQTPATQEAIMLQISRTLIREKVSLVVVGGTDVLDLIFISRFMRHNCPDIRLMIYASDALFIHGFDTFDFTGMLALSTYPLLPDNLRWSAGGEYERRFFSSYGAEGMFNATLALLDSGKRLREYSPVDQPQSLDVPPAWLTVIGRDGYWPVALFRQREPAEDPTIAPGPSGLTRLVPAPPSVGWSAIFYFCTLLVLVYAGVYGYVVWVHGVKARPLPHWCAPIHPAPAHASVRPAHYSFLFAIVILLAYLTVLIAPVRLAWSSADPRWWAMALSGVVTIGFMSLVLYHVSRGCRKRVVGSISLAAGLMAFTYVSLMIHGWPRRPFDSTEWNAMTLFRATRSVQVDSGAAPTLPLFFFLLALGWWAWVHMRRFHLEAQQFPAPPHPPAGCVSSLNALKGWLGQGFLRIDTFGWTVFAVAFASLFVVSEGIGGTIETVEFGHTICALIALMGALLLVSAYSVVRITRALIALLNGIENQPVRKAFSGLPSESSWAQIWRHSIPNQGASLTVRTLESLRALCACDSHYYPGLEHDLKQLEAATAATLRSIQAGESEHRGEIKELQSTSAHIARKLSEQLHARGWNAAASGTLDKLGDPSRQGTIQKAVARWSGGDTLVGIQAAPEPDPDDKPDKIAAEIVALRYVQCFRYVMRHLRNLIEFMTYGFILCVLALNSYPFQALSLIRWSITSFAVPLGAVVLYVFKQMSKDAILSRSSSTQPGQLDHDFYVRFASTAALPLLTVVASHFPAVGRFLFSWVQPAISALH